MALVSRQQSVSGRVSRASDVSTQSKAAGSQTAQTTSETLNAAAPGVLSMLKTSTDVGDVGEFSFNTGRLPAALRPNHHRRNNPSRLSSSSNHSTYTYQTNHSRAPSQGSRRTSNAPNPQAWDAVSAISNTTGNGIGVRHGSMVSLQTLATMPPYDNRAPPMPRGPPRSSPYGPPLPYAQEARTYSLTHAPSLRPAKSSTSLRSQGGGQFQPPRPPFAYPARLKRTGFRTPSPALSDYASGPYPGSYGQPQALGDDPKFPIEPPIGHFAPNDFSYHPRFGHSQESFHGPPPGRNYGPPPGPPGRGMHRPGMPMYNGDYSHGPPPGQRYADPLSPMMQQPIHANFPEPTLYGQYDHQVRPGPSLINTPYGTMPRAGTPQMDSMPSSSEPSSSVPHSSNPPTPRDATTVQVNINPAFVDPALSELPDEQSDYKSVQRYLKYTEQSAMYELDASQPAAVELEADAPTTRTGIVQRIRNLLEDRAASQDHLQSNEQKSSQQDISRKLVVPQCLHTKQSHEELLVELPVDLPANLLVSKRSSPDEPFELEAPARITRQLIKANTAPSSSEQNTTTSLCPEETVKARAHQAREPTTFQSPSEWPACPSIGHSTAAPSSPKESNDEVSASSVQSQPNHVDFAVQIKSSGLRVSPDPTNEQKVTADGDIIEHSGDYQSGGVSPMRPDEKVVRDSIVSPMGTQTLQITAIQEQPKLPGSFPGDTVTAGSPRAMSSFRKTLDSSDMASGFSLPAEPTQTYEASQTTAPVTDVAIKFSVPRTSEHGKAQLVHLSNLSDTPVRTSTEVKKARSAEDNSLQASFSSIEKVAPLRIRRMEGFSSMNSSTEGADLSSFIRRSFPRKKSMWSSQNDSIRPSNDSTMDIGTSVFKPLPGHLPDLKEDSKEDMSIRNTRSSYTGLGLPMSPPLNLRAGRDNVRRSEEAPQPSYLGSRPPRMSLSELREIPSLNFSRMDLFDKLNEELETHVSRSSKSLAGVKGERASETRHSSLRPASSEEIRERYKSFFIKPEDPESVEFSQQPITESIGGEDGGDTETPDPQQYNPNDADMMSTRSFARSMRPMSSERILSVASEVNRLSIPSVAALTERLSELLPTIKHLNLHSAIGDEKALNDTIDEIHHLGIPETEGTGLIRSSTGLRQLAAVAEKIVANGTHDSALFEIKSGRLMKELPPLPEDTEKFSLSDSGLDRNTTFITEGLTSTSDIEMPRPALLRGKSLSMIESKDEDLHPGFAPRRSLVVSTQSSRPWNLDENYPWCGNSPAININFPTPVLRRHSSPPELAHGSSQTSGNLVNETDDTLEPESTLPSSPLVSSTDAIGPTVLATHGRKSSKRSLIGSLSRRIGLNTRSQSGAGARESVLAERASPGDRYPYTGLQPPHSFNIDEVRSFFSDSTSDEHGEERRGSFRKHINSLRTRSSRLPGRVSVPYSQSLDMHRAQSLDQHGRSSNIHATGSLFDDRFTEPMTPQNYDGMVGMGRVEFRVKRVAERLRHIWMKGGEMIRSLSQRSRSANKRQHQERETEVDNWLADSLYSRD